MCTITIYTKCLPSCTQSEHHQHAYHAVQWGYHPSESRIWPTSQLLLQMVDTCHYLKKKKNPFKNCFTIWTRNTIIWSMGDETNCSPILPSMPYCSKSMAGQTSASKISVLMEFNKSVKNKQKKTLENSQNVLYSSLLSKMTSAIPQLTDFFYHQKTLMSANETGSSPILPTSP